MKKIHKDTRAAAAKVVKRVPRSSLDDVSRLVSSDVVLEDDDDVYIVDSKELHANLPQSARDSAAQVAEYQARVPKLLEELRNIAAGLGDPDKLAGANIAGCYKHIEQMTEAIAKMTAAADENDAQAWADIAKQNARCVETYGLINSEIERLVRLGLLKRLAAQMSAYTIKLD